MTKKEPLLGAQSAPHGDGKLPSPGKAEFGGSGGPPPDPLEPFNSRVPRSLQRRLKVHAALHGVKIQDVLSAALSEYLSARGS